MGSRGLRLPVGGKLTEVLNSFLPFSSECRRRVPSNIVNTEVVLHVVARTVLVVLLMVAVTEVKR